MKALIHSAIVKHAVIQLPCDSDSPGRLVRAYPNEQARRSLIAEPSIIGHEFSRPEQASASVAGNFNNSIAPGSVGQQQRVNDYRRCSHCAHAYSALQFAFASAVLVLYSKNILSSIIRVILGI
jgi:hypothetical protein